MTDVSAFATATGSSLNFSTSARAQAPTEQCAKGKPRHDAKENGDIERQKIIDIVESFKVEDGFWGKGMTELMTEVILDSIVVAIKNSDKIKQQPLKKHFVHPDCNNPDCHNPNRGGACGKCSKPESEIEIAEELYFNPWTKETQIYGIKSNRKLIIELQKAVNKINKQLEVEVG
jgi:hypothetical protein